MPALYRITADPKPLGTVELLRETSDEITHEEIKKELSLPSGIWEHVSCQVEGELIHLFCDDNGQAFELPINLRGSLFYANYHLVKPYTLRKLLGAEENLRIWHTDANIMLARGLIIVGDCLIWTGEMS